MAMSTTPTLPLPAEAVAALLHEIAQRMELANESPFKIRAYDTAAMSLHALTEPLAKLIAAGKVRSIPGVGEAIAEKIVRLHKTGAHPTLDYLREQHPRRPAGTDENLRRRAEESRRALRDAQDRQSRTTRRRL